MAYNCVPRQCDHNLGSFCAPVQRFSSSTLTYNGKALGNAGNNNARVINEHSALVANYFSAVSSSQTTQMPTSRPSKQSTSQPTSSSSCILSQQPCSEWGQCCENLFCNKQKGLCKPCINASKSCKRSIQCCGTNACLSGTCQACIVSGGACSITEDCCAGGGLACVGGTCQLAL